jgi:hypothetical protein
MATPAEIRVWARENGIEVGQRGRLHPDVLAKYTKAQDDQASRPEITKTATKTKLVEQSLPDSDRDVILAWAHTHGYPDAQKVGKKIREAYTRALHYAPVEIATVAESSTSVKTGHKCGFCYGFDHNIRQIVSAPESRHVYCQGTVRTGRRSWTCECKHPIHKKEVEA